MSDHTSAGPGDGRTLGGENRGALTGVRVLDLTHQVAGPSSTLMLAFLGAEVVKVIAPGSRDSYDPIPFYLNNASKKSIELDLKSGPGLAAALRLAERFFAPRALVLNGDTFLDADYSEIVEEHLIRAAREGVRATLTLCRLWHG